LQLWSLHIIELSLICLCQKCHYFSRSSNALLLNEGNFYLEIVVMSVMTKQLLTAKALSEMLSLSKRTVFRLNSSGRIPAPVRIGGSVRWRQSDIEKFISLDCPDRESFEAMRGLQNEH
jgi:excisionase family DNA binding protein